MTAHSSTSTDFTLRTLPKADRVEELRRQMAAIPGRSVEPATPMSLAVPASKPAAASAESILRLLPVAPAFAKLLPRGGLPRGSVVSVTGARSVLVSLVAEVTGSGGHAAVIGLPQFGLLSAVEMGADLTKCAFSRSPVPIRSTSRRSCSTGWTWWSLGSVGWQCPPVAPGL